MSKTLLPVLVAASSALALLALGCSSPDKASAEPTTDASPAQNATKNPAPAAPTQEAAASFADVSAILTSSCVGCHGAARPREGLSLVSYESLMKGSEHGPVVVAGDPASSKIVKALKGEGMDRMPFKQPALSAEDIAKIEAWIAAGANAE